MVGVKYTDKYPPLLGMEDVGGTMEDVFEKDFKL